MFLHKCVQYNEKMKHALEAYALIEIQLKKINKKRLYLSSEE